jgi:hypothetical protein
MQDPPERAIQKYLREHPEVREILEKFLLSSAEYERALRAVASVFPSPPHSLQMAIRNGVSWRPVRG